MPPSVWLERWTHSVCRCRWYASSKISGGTSTFFGPILGVVALTLINEVILRSLGVDQARPLIYGAILIASILFLPNGLESLEPMLKGRFAGKAPGGPGSEGEKAAAE